MKINNFYQLNQWSLPAGYEEIIDTLLQLRCKKSGDLNQTESELLNRKIYQAVQQDNSNYQKPDSSRCKPFSPIAAKGVLLWSLLSRSIGEVKYDSYPSRYLRKFPSVKSWTDEQRRALARVIKQNYHLSEEEFAKVEAEVDYITSNLNIKNAIVDYVVKRLNNGLSHCQLFYALTGCNALRHDHIDVTITNATIFFSFEFTDKGLKERDHFSFSDHQHVEELLSQLELFSNTERTSFPAVGKWESLKLQDEFLTDMQSFLIEQYQLEVSVDIIASTIATMSYLLPHEDAESFFVHDAYGHSWQESLCEFEHLYEFIATFDDPCDFTLIRDAIEQTEGDLFERLKHAYENYYMHQIDVASNALLAEFTADAIEYHLQSLLVESGESIPTSSKMRHFSLFLDLSLNDIIKHASSIRAGIEKEFSQDRLLAIKKLVDENHPQLESDSLLNSIENWFSSQLKPVFFPDSTEQLSCIEQAIMVQLLRVYVPIDKKARTSDATELQQMLLVLTSLYQADPGNNYWLLHQFAEEFSYSHLSSR